MIKNKSQRRKQVSRRKGLKRKKSLKRKERINKKIHSRKRKKTKKKTIRRLPRAGMMRAARNLYDSIIGTPADEEETTPIRLYNLLHDGMTYIQNLRWIDPHNYNEESCAICLEDWSNDDPFVINCNHIFHKSCIQNSVRSGNASCPLCREQITTNLEDDAINKLKQMLNSMAQPLRVVRMGINPTLHNAYTKYKGDLRTLGRRGEEILNALEADDIDLPEVCIGDELTYILTDRGRRPRTSAMAAPGRQPGRITRRVNNIRLIRARPVLRVDGMIEETEDYELFLLEIHLDNNDIITIEYLPNGHLIIRDGHLDEEDAGWKYKFTKDGVVNRFIVDIVGVEQQARSVRQRRF